MSDPRAEAQALSDQAVATMAKALQEACVDVDYPSLPSLDFADVTQGILARQFQLWSVGVLSPAATTVPVYPLVARSLVDGVITLAWLSKNPGSAEQFKIYSAGRLKLLAEHWKVRDFGDQTEAMHEYAGQLTEVASSERWSAVLAVDVGDWNGKNIRQTAIDAGLKDLYDLWYSPLSADTHSEWMSLREHYVRPCNEELHPPHWVPIFDRPSRSVNSTALFTQFMFLSIEYAEKCLSVQIEGIEGVGELVARAAELMLEVGSPVKRSDTA